MVTSEIFQKKMTLSKKIFITSSILLVTTLFFFGLYNFSFRKKNTGENKQANQQKEEKQESIFSPAPKEKQTEKIQAISSGGVLGVVLDEKEERVKYYLTENGNVIETDLEGKNKKIISDTDLPGLKDVYWSSDREKVISRFNIEGKDAFYVYDYRSKSAKKLNEGFSVVRWSNVGDKIIYLYADAKKNERWISVADSDGTNWKNLTDAEFGSVSFAQVPQSALVAFWNQANAFEETKLKIVGIMGGDSKIIFSGKFGTDYRWSPDGKRILASSADVRGGGRIMLGVMNSNGGEYQDLGIPTFISKCVWSKDNKTVYYALPGSIPAGVVMPNDYQERKVITADTFWKVDVETGKKERLVELEWIKNSYDATNLFLSPSENALFFINRMDGKLHRLNF